MKTKFWNINGSPIQASEPMAVKIANGEPMTEISKEEFWSLVSARTPTGFGDDEDDMASANAFDRIN